MFLGFGKVQGHGGREREEAPPAEQLLGDVSIPLKFKGTRRAV